MTKKSVSKKSTAPARKHSGLSIVTTGASASARVYGDLSAMPSIGLCAHEFRPLPDGRLAHFMDGVLRAEVPPEGLRDYADAWPDCKPLADALLAADR